VRATGSARIDGNALRLQFEGSSTFEAWLEAIDGATRYVHFENYIIRDDRVGRAFRDALVSKARAGVPVHLLYDWVGCWATPRRYWRPLKDAGVVVRAFNPPSVRNPLGVFQRDHRKLVCVDGEVAFVGGFCVGAAWAGGRDRPPWRDTGVEIRGPAAAAASRAFERIWAEVGDPLPAGLREDARDRPQVGDTPVWLIEGEPGRSRVYRALTLVAAHARERLWITDPYFVAPAPVSQALAAAARDGVDVRVLLPGTNNWPLVGSVSRSGYRFLMDAGVRLFEWQGPMIHAKTSVADGVWCRVGSSNLNAASLLGNWEMDVGVLDEGLAGQLEGLFLADLASSVEIVLPGVRVPVRAGDLPALREPPKHPLDPEGTLSQRLERELRASVSRRGTGAARINLAHVVRASTILGDALAGNRTLGREDRTVLGTVATLVLVMGIVAAFLPELVGWLVAVMLLWMGIVTGARAYFQARRARVEERAPHVENEEAETES
jgi:cardiolipin synthase